jgi:hypothetical protein
MNARPIAQLGIVLFACCLFAPLRAQDPEPFLSYDFADESLDDFFVPEMSDFCAGPISMGTVTSEDEALLLTNDETFGNCLFSLHPDVVAANFPSSRNYSVRLRFNLVDNIELAVYLRARIGVDTDTDFADGELERGYAFTVFPEGGTIPFLPDGTLAIAEWSGCHTIIEHANWPNGTFGAGWSDPGFAIFADEWYWLELTVSGDDDGGPVTLTGKIWEDGEDAPEVPQLIVIDPNGLNHDEQTLAPEADVQLMFLTGADLDLNIPLLTTLIDDISITELEVACAGGLRCLANQATGEVDLSWSKGQRFEGTLELRRDGEVIAVPGPDDESFTDTPSDGAHVYELTVTADEGAGQAQCNATFSCRAIVATGALFFDDFNAYRGDADLMAAGWDPVDVNDPVENATFTVTNPAGRANPPTSNGTPTFGRFLISDSDAASGSNPTGSGMSHDVWSPTFSCEGTDTVWLHADVFLELNNNGRCVFDVDVTTDGGDTWENVFRRVAPARWNPGWEPLVTFDNADNLFGLLDIDISAQAAGESEVRLRFRHFEPNDDWWVAIDNVRVDSTPTLGGDVVVLATESFDDWPPDDWEVESLDDEFAPWDVLDECGISLPNSDPPEFPDATDGRSLHHLDESFALVSSYCSGFDENELLLTPPLDCSELQGVYLHFESDVLTVDGGLAIEEVLLSLDGGETYEAEPIFSYQAGGGGYEDTEVYYNEFVLSIPRAVGESDVVIAFHYQAPGGEASFWAIDNVQVTADGPPGTRYVRADVNADGTGDLSDAVFLLSFLFLGGAPPSCDKSADSNDSASVDLSDAVFVLNHLFSGGPAPPEPFGECGLDPTEDGLDCVSFPPCEG